MRTWSPAIRSKRRQPRRKAPDVSSWRKIPFKAAVMVWERPISCVPLIPSKPRHSDREWSNRRKRLLLGLKPNQRVEAERLS